MPAGPEPQAKPAEPLQRRAAGWHELLRPGAATDAGRSGRRRDELEFLPAALEIVETPASPAGRVLALTICSFFVVALAWACWSQVDVIAAATGRIIPSNRTKTIQPLEIGVVRAIHVAEGQAVRAGDLLIELDPTTSAAERERLSGELTAVLVEVARLTAAAEGKESAFVPPARAGGALVTLHRRLLAGMLAEQRARLIGLGQQLAQKAADRAAIAATIAKLEATVPLLAERAAARKTLAEHQTGSRMAWLELQQDLSEMGGELAVQRSRLAEAEAAIAGAVAARGQAEAEFQRSVLGDLAHARDKAASIGQELIKAEQRAGLHRLASPVDGTIQQLQVTTVGGVVTPAQPLMSIVPKDSRIEVEATLQNKDIGFVEPGQPVEIKIDTFNFTRYGLIHGTVTSVSHDAIQRDRPGDARTSQNPAAGGPVPSGAGQDLVFTARIALDQTEMMIEGKPVSLAPGMAVTAEIRTGSRRIVEYLLSPILKYRHEVLRER